MKKLENGSLGTQYIFYVKKMTFYKFWVKLYKKGFDFSKLELKEKV